eukprot:TRINITY_DN3963_c2_g1_i1.p1 TRINITY_DN3963_c2_g1~~TRINITY_DN3963_c2_g1_i1.p1  ORF type:complete len:123 (-),score=6.15 TRINITY_DN3963_c2_g1_i1:129-497(-)
MLRLLLIWDCSNHQRECMGEWERKEQKGIGRSVQCSLLTLQPCPPTTVGRWGGFRSLQENCNRGMPGELIHCRTFLPRTFLSFIFFSFASFAGVVNWLEEQINHSSNSLLLKQKHNQFENGR